MDIGIYVRVSVIDKKNKESPEIHEERGRRYAQAKGWNVVSVYTLPGISGKSTLHHKETQQMLEDIETGKIQGLIFSKLARLARNTEELLYYSKHFQKYDANLISLNESIDTSTSSGRLFYTMISAMGQWERENNLERMMASIETRRAMGKFVGGNVSYGFSIEKAQVIINEEEAPIRELMYDLFLEYKRRSTVAKILNERGYRSPKGKKWSDTSVIRLLKNTDAKGMRKSNYTRKQTEDNLSRIKPSSEWIYVDCPQIVSEEKWESVNAIIREQESKSKQTKPLNQRVHLFTGLLFCRSDHKMTLATKTNKYTCVQCKTRIDKDDLEDIFKTRLEQFIISDEEQFEYAKSSEKEIQFKKDEIEFAEKSISDIEKKMDRLVTLSIEDQIPIKGFKEHYDPLFEQKEQLYITIKNLKMELTTMYEAKNSRKMVFDKSKNLYENWHKLDRPEKRYIVQSVLNKVSFDGKNINFKLKQIAPLSSLELGQNGQRGGIML